MNSSYVKALETKARWLKWFRENPGVDKSQEQRVGPAYERSLQTQDTHFMNDKFCSLVDHARRSVPDDLKFDMSWTHDRYGWMWLETPFECPKFVLDESVCGVIPEEAVKLKKMIGKQVDVKISAVGWVPVGKITDSESGHRLGEYARDTDESVGTAFLLFVEADGGFGMWSYFTLMDGDVLIDRVHNFEKIAEKDGGAYKTERETDELHEIRWIYTAFHLMSQKLAIQVPVKTDRAVKRRAEREGRMVPESIRVISLRRLEADRPKSESDDAKTIDWKWQWEVRGHWRNQFYAATNEHRQVFIEAYIKGPEDKPLKDPGQRLFVAVR